MADIQPTTRDWSDTEFVRNHIQEAANYVRDVFVDRQIRYCGHAKTESPLESIFLAWWAALAQSGQISGSMVEVHRQYEVQAQTRKYRLDFALIPEEPLRYRAQQVGVPVPVVAVELDGHDFHERTREQVEYRNQRDRDLMLLGIRVLHFSGSEINRRPDECVDEAFGAAFSGVFPFESAVISAERAKENEAGL